MTYLHRAGNTQVSRLEINVSVVQVTENMVTLLGVHLFVLATALFAAEELGAIRSSMHLEVGMTRNTHSFFI